MSSHNPSAPPGAGSGSAPSPSLLAASSFNGTEGVVSFPWRREPSQDVVSAGISRDAKAGEYILQNLFVEFCRITERRIELVLSEPLERPLSKSLQRGEDVQFDQVLSALGNVAEHCLPSILKTLFAWYQRQMKDDSPFLDSRQRHRSKGSKDYLCERRDLAVEFVYCLVLIEVLSKLSYHPGHEDMVGYIIDQCFRHFKYRDGSVLQSNPNASNINIIADLYAEVIGVLASSRFLAVRKKFMNELKELKLRDQTPYTAQSIISLLMGLKFFRVKMHPIEEFELCVQLLLELGHYFLEVKDRDIKHALAGLFVEILLPVAATVKNEVNIPVLKKLVEDLYTVTVDMATKRKHTLHLFPLVTCLLCVSQKQFFLNNWHYFLSMCLSQLKNRDVKMSRVALESLYRLLWVYMVRIKCESNTATQSRLQSIVNSLFPKGSKLVTPKDMPLNIFVKIIQFIAKERLDFAIKDIIFDLLCVGRNNKFLTPERMSIGLRAFLVIADSLQQKDGDPPMPQSSSCLPSGSTVRVKKTFLNKMLSDISAKSIGLAPYYPYILKTFDSILRALDLQVGRSLLMTKSENANKEPEEMITNDRKPKLDLFRTCIAAIPRLIPDGMTSQELVELITRLTVHVDEELKVLAVQALQNLMSESVAWRDHVVHGFVQFIQKDISDTKPALLDNTLRLLSQLLVQWKSTLTPANNSQPTPKDSAMSVAHVEVLHEVEGLCLVMMCSCRVVTRKLAVHLLKEVRNIFNMYSEHQVCSASLLEVIDKACPAVMEKLMPLLPSSEKPILLTLPSMDLAWVTDRAVTLWLPAGGGSMQDGHQINYSFHRVDMWIRCIAEFASTEHAQTLCPRAVAHAWPIVYTRLNALFPLVDPSAQTEQTRASSILRSAGSKKGTSEKDVHMQLWQNYVIMACTVAMHSNCLLHRCSSPELGAASSPESDKALTVQACTATNLFQRLVPLMRCDSSDMRDTIVNGLGYCNPGVFKELAEELLPFLKEAIDKKQDNLRRRRKRDILRVQLAHIFELMAENKAFAQSESGVIDMETGSLSSMFVDYIDGARQYLEGENDRDLPILQEIRLHFSGFVQHLICNTPMEYRKKLLSRDLRYSLFHLFANWSGHFNLTFGSGDKRHNKEEPWSEQELSAARAMSAVLCCGKVFDANGLNDDGYIYHWLDTLLSSHDDKIYELAKETVFLLLDFNSEAQALLDWVIDRCYTGQNEVADGCFNALAAVFQTREYPCDHVAMLNLSVLNVGSPRISTHETAVQLLHLLDLRFFQEAPVFRETPGECGGHPMTPLNDILLSVSYCNSQIFVSDQLARIHTDLTMPMFSEITQRFQTARPSVRQTLLKYLLPWLHNMELVDPSLPQNSPLASFLTRLTDAQTDVFVPPLKGEGWGSTQATEMVLNNLFYITVNFGDEHPLEIEALWAALVSCWPFNLKVIIRYLVIITNIAAVDLLPYAKRVVTYLGRAKPEKLVDELMNELQTVETLNVNIERTQTPPFYRLCSIKKPTSAPSAADDEKTVSPVPDYQLEKGILHTKRHSANEEVQHESTPRTNSTASLKSITSNSTESTAEQMVLDEDVIGPAQARCSSVEMRRSESPAPYPLPMPAYGGYFAPLNECLPENFSPTPGFHRSNIAVMFLCDLVLDGLEVDWSPHLPLMLHVIFLGLDHSRALVYEHCKKLLQNLLLLASSQEQVSAATSRLLLAFRSSVADTLKVISEDRDAQLTLETPSRDPHIQYITKSTFSIDSSATMTPDSTTEYTDPEMLSTVDDVIKAMLSFMESRKGRPLWSSEDITPKMLSTQSATHLSYFLKYTVRCFKELSPLALVEQRWSQVSLQLALSCSSRHYAGRSFQILRALQIRPSTQMLSDILSRLVETVAEQGEDMQGYVTEMMLTLEASIDNLDLEFRPIDFMRELFMSTPNLAKDATDSRRSAITAPRQVHPHHARSTSYTVSAYTQRAYAGGGDGRIRSCTEVESRKSNLGRSRSAQSLKNLDQTGAEDKLTLVTQMFWMTVSLLESDYEYEFSLAVKLLDKILCHLQPERPECRDKLDKILNQIKWPNFPGVYILLLKGCTSPMASESTWALLSKIILCVNSPVIDPSTSWGFPMVTIALLPYLVQNYENPSQICRDTADRVAQVCNHQGDRLSNLATVMSLYSRGTFGKDSFQWTKCVVKYLLDEYAPSAVSMVSFLVEVLEKGQPSYQQSCLQILYCMVHYLDVQSATSTVVNQELFHAVSKYLQSHHWREALKIVKLAVTRSSTLAAPPPSSGATTSSSELTMFSHSALTSFAEAESLTKFSKELPGRTLDFTIDLSKVPIIGRKFISPETNKPSAAEEKERATSSSISGSAVSLSRKPSNNQDLDSVWRRPQASQARTRERLVNLLTCFGQRVGLPKSPSVIFSQSSDTLDHQASVGGSSGEETSLPEASSNDTLLGNESSGNELMVTFKGFDFLDNELEESESEDFFFQLGDRRHSLHLEHSPTSSGRPNFGSEPNLQMMSTLPKVVGSPRDSVTEQPSTDEESESSEQETSGATATSDPAVGSTSIQVNSSALGRLRSSPLTASTQSLSSNTPSESDTVDLNSSQASPALSQLSAALLTLPADEVEEVWRAHVVKVMAECSLTHVGKTCQIFPRLFRELRKRLTTMTKEACYYISKSESLKNVTSQILQVLDLVHQQLECPFLYSESDSLLGSRLLDRHRFCVLEIQECFETYSLRKDQAEQSLESLKSSIKQQSLGDGGSFIFCGEEQQVELCHRLYKLLFQLVLLFESYLKLLDAFHLVTASPQVNDMSGQVISVRKELVLALEELDNGQASPFNVDTKVVSKQEAVAALAEYLTGGQYLRAIQILRCFRSLWPSDVFGMTVEDDVLMLLNIYCSSLAEKKSGVFALTKTSLELTPLYGQLMDINVSLNSSSPPGSTSASLTSAAAAAAVPSSSSGPPSAPTQTGGRDSRGSFSSGGGGGDGGGISPARLEVLLRSSDSSIL
ncbi:protein furry homolog isoform X2 [Aplysia californica]|uniref:Protein furry homolog isoform X2 n=1 Tax=Aplysia californica TaxID=6500 RepID=A0ABM1AD57_APLCA|nr:protein furry homolog isoform X2 [Aplysia californica]